MSSAIYPELRKERLALQLGTAEETAESEGTGKHEASSERDQRAEVLCMGHIAEMG
jgi:hypothetical protein